jgi:hypothetical protein
MQTKSSYRALKWTLFMGLAGSLASACIVSSGDGDDDDVSVDGGDGGTNNTSGTKNTGGTKAGSSAGGSSAGTATAGTTAMAGAGGEVSTYVPGACESDLKTPSMLPSCDSKPDDNECGACLKMNCCDALQACYGTEPTSACGYGATSDEDPGQFDCIRACYERDNDGVKLEQDIIQDCGAECLNQCQDEAGVNDDTLDLMGCALNGADDDPDKGDDDCHAVCFPPPM